MASSGVCSLCETGITMPDNPITLQPLPFVQTCADLEPILPLLSSNSPECHLLQSISTLCGCTKRADACELCGNETKANNKELDVFESVVGFVTTCDTFQAYLQSLPSSDGLCDLSRELVGGFCGCSTDETDGDNIFESKSKCSLCASGKIPDKDKQLNLTGVPFRTCGQFQDAIETLVLADSDMCGVVQGSIAPLCGCPVSNEEESCTFCPDGSSVPESFLDKEIAFFDPIMGIHPTCALIEAHFRATLQKGTADCANVHSFSSYCGCPPRQGHCVFCHGEPLPSKNRVLSFLAESLDLEEKGIQPTCELYETLQFQLEGQTKDCFNLGSRAFLCGCNGGIWDYGIAADTEWKQALLLWVPRVSGMVSLVGALTVILYITCSRKRRSQFYNQIVAGMAGFDAATGWSWMIGTLATPATYLGDASGVYGARGNELTCDLNAFIGQLGFASVFYTISLLVYYKLVIVNGWRTNKLRRNRWLFHVIPSGIGFAFAFAGLRFYQISIYGCYINTYSFLHTWRLSVIFIFGPTIISLLLITGLTLRIYFHVRYQSRLSRQWRVSNVVRRYEEASDPMTLDQSASDHLGRGDSLYQRSEQPQSKPNTTSGGLAVHEEASSSRRGSGSSVPRTPTNNMQRASRSPHQRRSRVSTARRLEKEVLWHAIAYLLAFWISWPILIVATFLSSWDHYWFGPLAFCLAPLQGFFNFLVYFRTYFARNILPSCRLKGTGDQSGSLRCYKSSCLDCISCCRDNEAVSEEETDPSFVGSDITSINECDPNVLISWERNVPQERPETPGAVAEEMTIEETTPESAHTVVERMGGFA